MHIERLVVNPMKKSPIKTSLKKQLGWFLALYLISILALGSFHEFSKWLIYVLK